MAYATTNPYTGETLKTFPNATDEDVSLALNQADTAFHQWKLTSISDRVKVLKKAADLLRARHTEYAKFLTLEMGKLLSEAEAEVELSAAIFEYYVEHAEQQLAPEKLPSKDPAVTEAWLVHEPLGIILAIEPWNFPYYQIARIIAPQLAAGNVLVLKHASNVPQSADLFEKLMLEAGLPVGGFRNIYATRKQIETIINDPRVHGVALTGSEGAGAVVASQAGKALKKSTMELGGADAFLVLEDADLDKAARWAVFGRHWNAGQVCCSSKRLIVIEAIYEAFIERYIAGVAALKAGDPLDPETSLAPLSSQGAADDVRRQVEEAVAHGASATVIGSEVPARGAFVRPVMLTNLTKENPAYYQEFFGPISLVFKAKDETEAIQIANDSPFGLGGSVFTQDIERGKRVARQISTGMVYINHPTAVKADLPFGGIRRSGYGRELIGLDLKEFVNHKLIGVTDIDGNF
ncbi:NAD-dependent succinate-semialdehyde dehydrogenase [Erwiniaceae bacterium BAC15a-03b]|uniref:NAD-dependent succinate-semialdehyde dehydrogenase n=1 Tax=Winslowiella arboricola TaxID=2978220 RepID=A0A9J6PYA6_9GAMM|nr:NAD-dependent succinate-semialdehyde dehydrogenase [Winslowiella arboricola]MCU5778991.1 NAD-dependent succinate-semialdehyde dehydrogenase [Winslowiella arboricola]